MEQKQLPKIALGAWAWGNDGTFGGALTSEELRPVFEAGMKAGLNLWDNGLCLRHGHIGKGARQISPRYAA